MRILRFFSLGLAVGGLLAPAHAAINVILDSTYSYVECSAGSSYFPGGGQGNQVGAGSGKDKTPFTNPTTAITNYSRTSTAVAPGTGTSSIAGNFNYSRATDGTKVDVTLDFQMSASTPVASGRFFDSSLVNWRMEFRLEKPTRCTSSLTLSPANPLYPDGTVEWSALLVPTTGGSQIDLRSFDGTLEAGRYLLIVKLAAYTTYENGAADNRASDSTSINGDFHLIEQDQTLEAKADDFSIRTAAGTIDVLANDTADTGAVLSITAVTQGAKGKVAIKKGAHPMVSYTPGRGFDGADTFTYTVSDDVGNSDTGTVTVRNPFFDLRGTFSQLVTGPSGVVGTLGATLSAGGGVTGKLVIGGKTYTLRGAAGFDGIFTQNFPRKGGLPDLVLALTFDDPDGDAMVVGGVTGDPDAYIIEAVALNGTVLPTGVSSGAYTLFLSPDADAAHPRGIGWAKGTLSPLGKVKFAGRLGDDTPFSVAGVLNSDLEIVVFTSLYAKPKGELAGTLTVAPGTRTLAAGDLAWRKPMQTRPLGLFPGGFAVTTAVKGAAYVVPPREQRSLVYTVPADAKADLEASGASVATVNAALLVSAADRVKAEAPNANNVSVKISRTTGMISGRFTPTGATRPFSFTGILQQQEDRGAGLFRGADQTGTVTVIPR